MDGALDAEMTASRSAPNVLHNAFLTVFGPQG